MYFFELRMVFLENRNHIRLPISTNRIRLIGVINDFVFQPHTLPLYFARGVRQFRVTITRQKQESVVIGVLERVFSFFASATHTTDQSVRHSFAFGCPVRLH